MTNNELNSMTLEQLRALNERVVTAIKAKRYVAAAETKSKIYLGANVKVSHPRLSGKQCRVEEVNRTRCVVSVLNGTGRCSVPLSMVTLNA
jgi:hypothetical protein